MKQQPGVWSGVKIGCGIFIVLPCILIGVFMIFASTTCGIVKEQKKAIEKAKQKGIERSELRKKN